MRFWGSNHEYGAVERTWRYVCDQRGAIYIPQPVALPVDDDGAIVEQIWSGVTERTKVITLSHITSPTALIMPIATICQRARARLTSSPSSTARMRWGRSIWICRRLGRISTAATVTNGCAHPKALDFSMPVQSVRRCSSRWSSVGGGNRASPMRSSFLAYPEGASFRDYYEWMGTDDPSAFLSVPAAIDFQNANDWSTVRRACHALLADASRRIAWLTGYAPFTPDDEAWWMQMRALPLPPCDPKEVQARLWNEFRVEVPLLRLGRRPADPDLHSGIQHSGRHRPIAGRAASNLTFVSAVVDIRHPGAACRASADSAAPAFVIP
jgi:isopenicillin-N epimerase